MSRCPKLQARRRRATTLVELVATFLILAFVTVGVLQLYRVGDKQQRDARFYTDAQTNTREALRRIMRTVRHASAVETATTGGTTFYPSVNPVSSTSQIVVTVPQPNSGSSSDHIRIYVSGGTLYAQRSDDTNAGLAIATGVTTLTFGYFQTVVTSTGTSTTQNDSAPGSATEVQITLILKSGTVTTTEAAYVSLRNKNLGL